MDEHRQGVATNGARAESRSEQGWGKDPEWFDAKAAGWWCWGQCCQIGGGWCSGAGPWVAVNGEMARRDDGNTAPGVLRTRPHVSAGGCGVNRPGTDIHGYMRGLAGRLRRVRVCCGDWSRVLTPCATTIHGIAGVFVDPPYSAEADRDMGCYAVDCGVVAHAVREWCIANGDNPAMRIVLAGYEGEHAMPPSWRVHAWTTQGGMANGSKEADSRGKQNTSRERLWFSPGCVRPEPGLFEQENVT